jgi:poly-gamma-glutamate capsule biosynthesis protein CapA/YwtB (metallophosphatase superfamily)
LALVALVAAGCQGDRPTGGLPDRPSPPASFTIAATGDILIHAEVASRAGGDYRPLFAEVRPVLAATDLALCHLETPLSPAGAGVSFGPRFSVPGSLATAIADAGYDACSTASNHALDFGEPGVRSTLDLLDAAGVRHTGTARNRAEVTRPLLVPVPGAMAGLLSYTFGFNEGGLPPDRAWLANRIDERRILADAAAAKSAGADFVVVSLHWGTEYQPRPDPSQRALARRLLASPAVDLLLGHHPHVVQPVERVGDKYVAYSLGNFLSGQPDRCCPSPRDGVIAQVTVEKTTAGFRVSRFCAVPTTVEPGTYRVRQGKSSDLSTSGVANSDHFVSGRGRRCSW